MDQQRDADKPLPLDVAISFLARDEPVAAALHDLIANDLKSVGREAVRVRVPPSPPFEARPRPLPSFRRECPGGAYNCWRSPWDRATRRLTVTTPHGSPRAVRSSARQM